MIAGGRRPDLLRHLADQVRHPALLRQPASATRTSSTSCSPSRAGLCDAIFRALPLIAPAETVVIGLPDTIWFPEDGLTALPDERLSFLLFPVDRPELFDAVVTDAGRPGARGPGQAAPTPRSRWVWGAFKMPGAVLRDAVTAVVRARAARRVPRARWSTPSSRAGGEAWACAPARLRRRRHAGRLPRGAPAARRGAARGSDADRRRPRRAHRARALSDAAGRGGAQPRGDRARACASSAPWFHNIDLRRRPDRARPLPRRLPGGQVAALRPRAAGGSARQDGARHRLQRRLLRDRDEAARRGPRGRHRQRRRTTWRRRASRPRSAASRSSSASSRSTTSAALGERFDLVLFMGVLYHLRHPLLALDLIHEHVARDLLVFQSMQRGSAEVEPLEADYPFSEARSSTGPAFPRLHFVERRYSGDPTNWWVPNRACVGGDAAQRRLRDPRPPRGGGLRLPPREPSCRRAAARSTPAARGGSA